MMNSELITSAAIALALCNLVAALILLFSRRDASESAEDLVSSPEEPAPALASEDPAPVIRGSQVRAAYERSGRLRGEARLAADVEGWKSRSKGGEFLPVAADSCRNGTPRARRTQVGRPSSRGIEACSELARGLKPDELEVSHV